ncbi:MAG: acyl-CoA thioesterase [bacterium]
MFEYNTRVNFYNCDPAGILFFAEIFKFAHSAYEVFLTNLNLNKNYFNDDKIALPIIKTSAEYSKPLKSGEKIKIQLFVTQIKENSFEISYNIYDNSNELCCKVVTVHVCIDKMTSKKVGLDYEFVKKITEYKC